MIGATNTAVLKDFHFLDVLSDINSTCSVADSHDLPTTPEEAKRRLPTPEALVHRDEASWEAKPAMAAARTAIRGKKR